MRTYGGIMILSAAMLVACVGCSDPMYGLADYEKQDLKDWKEDGVDLVREKSPYKATWLGFAFGAGSFYTGHWMSGVADLLLWPWSMLWEPWIAPAYANEANYYATRAAWVRRKRKSQ